jgi:hypothetical protein
LPYSNNMDDAGETDQDANSQLMASTSWTSSQGLKMSMRVAMMTCGFCLLVSLRVERRIMTLKVSFDQWKLDNLSENDHVNNNSNNNIPEADPAASSHLHFSPRHPLLVLSLPNSADLVIPRLFQCAKVSRKQVGRYCTRHHPRVQSRQPIEKCMLQDMLKNATTFEDCNGGRYSVSVWTNLQFLEGALVNRNSSPSEIVLF